MCLYPVAFYFLNKLMGMVQYVRGVGVTVGDQIEFPKNFGTYINKSMELLQNSDYKEAVSLLKKAYAIKEENNLNVLLVSALFQNGDIEEAMLYATEKESFYETNEKRLIMYVEILLANDQYLHAQKYISHHLNQTFTPFEESWLKLNQELQRKKEEEIKKQRLKEEAIMKSLFSLASLSIEEQFQVIEEAEKVGTDNLKKVAPSLFQNPYVNPIVRSTLLSILIKREDNTLYAYSWFNENKSVVPNECRQFEDTKTVVYMLNRIEELFEQDPSLYELVSSETKMILLFLYPFIDEVIAQDTEDWLHIIVESIQEDYVGGKAVKQVKRDSIEKWIEKIHKEMQGIE